ncbi:hypothetical protein [Couchioplanes caeruleus]|uniref:Uncharacterized protein n=2 Tax=Couchioplanes caeruleus TaxID=56438 RepID=A0A1K0FRQ2_9ACTN|nr:hypothetical protein [Couchioplanes caeruleus]OJF15517.1 hypothetical protein BG844_04025 [Couchioplanes caeruleus subsp. caeruleus]ROP30944.1 hypothetical protein EDD30_3829 [Couchioplanes caeruleus]
MRLFSDDTRRDRETLIQARQHLAEVSDRDRYESDDYLDANDAVIDAEQPLKWWQRLDIDLDLHHRRDDGDADTPDSARRRADADEF